MPLRTRRDFLAETSAALALAATARGADAAGVSFTSAWDRMPDRVWTGADTWANPLQDWRIQGGRLECVKAAPGRNLHLLTHDADTGEGTLSLAVTIGRLEGGAVGSGAGSAGFSLGVKGPLGDFRNALVHGSGFHCGLRAKEGLFIGDGPNGRAEAVTFDAAAVRLELTAEPVAEGRSRVVLTARDAADNRLLGRVERDDVPSGFLAGNLALVSNYASSDKKNPPARGAAAWWFRDWTASGTRLRLHPSRAFGPIYFIQYAVHRGVLKLTAQMAPVGPGEAQTVRLEARRAGGWEKEAEARIDPLSRTAAFRVPNWNELAATPVRVVYGDAVFEGLVRANPAARGTLSVADVSCNAHYAFPNHDAATALIRLDPDLVAFTGDQYYESTAGFGVDNSSVENACLDVLRKWCLHGWTWRELIRDRPSVSIPDDHDVYHGNLWGEGGAAAPANNAPAEARGGYKMFADFVNAVHRMQTGHHPDSPGQPGLQGITAYYGPLTWGGVSFAILADRQYKAGPDGKVPPTTSGRADHVNDPAFDPATADKPGLDLLGGPQLEFLRGWARDWRGAEMKAVISQTIFTAMATHHGAKGGRLVADYDTNAWPQTARNEAVRVMRSCFAFHLAGDQHLPAVVRYGVDRHGDAGVAFAGPAVNNLYPRWFLPEGGRVTGDFTDSFGHPLTVLACANPKDERRPGVLDAEVDKSAGVGVVTFDTRARTVRVDCWPLLADVTRPGTQFPGWPVTVAQLDNGNRGEGLQLPLVTVENADKPLLEIRAAGTREPVYLYRAPGPSWQPFAPAPGAYDIQATDPETGHTGGMGGQTAGAVNRGRLQIRLGPSPQGQAPRGTP